MGPIPMVDRNHHHHRSVGNRDHTISIRLMFALVFAVECAVVFAPNPRRLSQTLEHRSSSTHKAHTRASVRTQTRFDTSCLLWPVHSRLSYEMCSGRAAASCCSWSLGVWICVWFFVGVRAERSPRVSLSLLPVRMLTCA